MMELDTIFCGDALNVLRTLPDNFVHCCITSPPYYALRDYGMDGQIGREDTPAQYVARLTEVFSEVRRVLLPSGTLWLNIADTYCGTGSKGDHLDPKNPSGRNEQGVALAQRVENVKAKDMLDGSGYEARFTQCGICTLMKKLGLYDLTPAMCHLDYTMSEVGGASNFVREYTLASGGPHCDCGYQKRS